jgi:aryl-alcohol dehydrogenase-like predicted oxidoreductase
MEPRRLGRSGVQVSPLGLGTARMAGLGWRDDLAPQGRSQAQREAVRQIQAAVDQGVTLFDTADNYGQGLSERVLGKALRGRRDGVVVATKFGEDPMPDQADPWFLDAASVRHKCEASLRRLEFESIDLYLLHRRDYPLERAPALLEVLEDLVRAGKIRTYGWSTDDEPHLTRDGRSVVQGALGWIWARSPLAIPLPGFRNLEQMQELVQARRFGPLPLDAMQAIEEQVKSAGIVRRA